MMTQIIRIPNIKNYTQEIISGELILTPIKKYITEDELINISFTNSIVATCLIKKGKKLYQLILINYQH